MAVGDLIPKIGYFCKSCGKFFPFISTRHQDTVRDDEGWGIEATYICPFCGRESKYSSSEATLENESERKAMGLSFFEWPPKK